MSHPTAADGAAPATMRAVVVTRPGGLDALRVKAFGVNESEEDTGLRPGQQVATMMGGMGRSYDGSYAQYVTVPAGQVIPFETGLPWDMAGALGRHC